MNGPIQMTRIQRLKIIGDIVGRVMEKYKSNVKAIGVYGSVARVTDGPYSDMEILCVLRSSGKSFTHEWSAGNWKAEVNFDSEDVVLKHAATVENDWPLTHGMYFSMLPLYDPENFFIKLRNVAKSPKKKDFHRAICRVLVEDLYESVGKWRNIQVRGPKEYLPSLATIVAKDGAMLVGLHNKTCFSTSAHVLIEALNLPNRPRGFDALCQIVMSGQLSDSKGIIHSCEHFWSGVIDWAIQYGYHIHHTKKIPI